MAVNLGRRCAVFSLKRTRAASNSPTASSQGYCFDLVRKLDYENFLCCLLINKHSRRSVFAVRALNVELAKISDSVTIETIGSMKNKFWRDAIDSIYTKKKPPEHPVVQELEKSIREHSMSKIWFTRLLDGREQSFGNRLFENSEALEEYAERSVSSVLYLTLEALGVKDTNADHCASHLGKAIGIVTLLRSTPYHAKFRRVLWPIDVLLQQSVSQEDILRGRNLSAIKEATYQLASTAHTHLNKARSLIKTVPRAGFRGLLPVVPCDNFLKSLQQADFNIFDPKLQQRNTLLPISLLKSAWRKKF